MNNFIKTIFLSIANKFGFKLEEKKDNTNDYYTKYDISITSIISDRMSTLTLMDSDLTVVGENARARYLNEFAAKLWQNDIKKACHLSLGTGDVLLKPSTDGKRFGVSLVRNSDFAITESVGDFIYGVLIKCNEIKLNGAIFERVEYHRLREFQGTYNCHIHQMCFKNGKEVPITSVPAWSEYSQETVISNVDRLLFGRIKCPTINRDNPNSLNGVPITFGLDNAVQQAKESYFRFNKEFEDKETMIFADKTLLTKDSEGNIEIPTNKRKLFMKMRGVDNNNLIDTYSPDIRDSALDNAIERNFRILEMACGLGEGVLTKSTLKYTNTDEVKASREMTFAFITNFRNSIDSGINDLIYAINVLCEVNQIATPNNRYDVKIDWSDKMLEKVNDTFNMLLQTKSMGELEDGELRAWVMNEDIELAKEKVKTIKQNSIEEF